MFDLIKVKKRINAGIYQEIREVEDRYKNAVKILYGIIEADPEFRPTPILDKEMSSQMLWDEVYGRYIIDLKKLFQNYG